MAQNFVRYMQPLFAETSLSPSLRFFFFQLYQNQKIHFQTSKMKWFITALSILLLNSSDSSAFSNGRLAARTGFVLHRQKLQKPDHPNDSKSSQNESSYRLAKHSTSLSMGLKDLLPFGKRNDDGDSRSENPEDIKLALEAIKADLEAVTALGSKRPAAVRKKVAPIEEDEEEEPKKKKRQLGGVPLPKPMSRSDTSRFDESVKDRMARIKSGVMTDEEKAAFLKNALTRTPQGSQTIRQDGASTKTSVSGSSPYARDALWSQITKDRGSRNESSKGRYASPSPKDLNEQAKRQYLDRVTDPDRFKSYAAMGGNKNEPTMKEDENDDIEPLVSESEETQEVTNVSSSSIDERENLASEQRQRALEMQRAGEIALTNVPVEKKENENPQIQSLPDLLKAQDEYWAKKLEEENRRKEAKMSEVEKEEFRRKLEKEKAAKAAAQAKRDIKQADIERLREEERLREDPHEAEILKEVRTLHKVAYFCFCSSNSLTLTFENRIDRLLKMSCMIVN